METLYKTKYDIPDMYKNRPLAILSENTDGSIQPVTVNLPGNVIPLGDRRAFYDINNADTTRLDRWVDTGDAEIIGQMQSGFVTYPLIELSNRLFNALAELPKDK